MVRFSCFQGHIHSPKQKKTVHLSSEAMHKTLEDAPKNQVLRNSPYPAAKDKPCLEENGDTLYDNSADHATDSSPTERDCKSEEIECKYNTDCDISISKDSKMKKSLSLGSGLNWKDKASVANGSDEDTEQRFSYDGSINCSGRGVQDRVNDQGLSLPDQYQEPVPSDSVQVNCDFAKDGSIFSLGDAQEPEKESGDKDDAPFSGAEDSRDGTPRTPPVLAKSSSLPSMGSPNRLSTSFLPRSRSAEDVNASNSRDKGLMHEGRHVEKEERDYSIFKNDKNYGENLADDAYESYNYVGSAKDWIIPEGVGVDVEKSTVGETSFHNWNEASPKDFRLKRIQEWVINLQHCGPLEDSDEISPSDERDLPKGDALVQEQTAEILEVKVSPGMEAAKRYISSLNASATAAQLTNLGLVVIPFLSAFGSLKALNLSGNAIVRITAGALPRGLHILNLSKNSISSIEGLRDLTRLRVLDLSYNRIIRIGHGLASCSSLKELYLAGNKISEVEGLHRLLKLNVLDLRFNKISTTKCLGQLAANYNCLQALSLEGNPAQKNVGDEQLKKYVQSLLPNLTYYNRQSVKAGTTKDTGDRSARLGIGAHQIDRGLRVESKTSRKNGIVAQKVPSSSVHGRKSQAVVSHKQSRSKHVRLPPSGMRTSTNGLQVAEISSRVLSLKNDFSIIRRSRSEGTLGAL